MLPRPRKNIQLFTHLKLITMKRITLPLIFGFIALSLSAQRIPLDLLSIQNMANGEKYEQLFARYAQNDTTLTQDDYTTLYYGDAFRPGYKPYVTHDSLNAYNAYLKQKIEMIDFKKVIDYTQMILEEFPFNIEPVFMTAVSYDRLGNKEMARQWFYKYNKLLGAILSSGDGKSENTAFIVTKVPDEYALLRALRVHPTGQQMETHENGKFDVVTLKENNFKIDKMFFNIDLFFGKINR